MSVKPPSSSSAQLIRWMGITDANSVGNVHGGTIMRLADEVAALAAIKHCHRRVVTAAMDGGGAASREPAGRTHSDTRRPAGRGRRPSG
ncbi:MAG: hypothetical protein JO240_04195 [Solirubrobacterales bacterium]|nr:hypothetical protein [Solirubrobacterales bacterium]